MHSVWKKKSIAIGLAVNMALMGSTVLMGCSPKGSVTPPTAEEEKDKDKDGGGSGGHSTFFGGTSGSGGSSVSGGSDSAGGKSAISSGGSYSGGHASSSSAS